MRFLRGGVAIPGPIIYLMMSNHLNIELLIRAAAGAKHFQTRISVRGMLIQKKPSIRQWNSYSRPRHRLKLENKPSQLVSCWMERN